MPSAVSRPLTLYDKVVRDHVVDEKEDGTLLIYIGSLLLTHGILIFGRVANYLTRPPFGARSHISSEYQANIKTLPFETRNSKR